MLLRYQVPLCTPPFHSMLPTCRTRIFWTQVSLFFGSEKHPTPTELLAGKPLLYSPNTAKTLGPVGREGKEGTSPQWGQQVFEVPLHGDLTALATWAPTLQP